MAIVGTGKWSRLPTEPSTSVDNRDYYSGVHPSISATTYVDANKLEFGFSATGVLIRNPSGVDLVFQWLRREGQVIDSGTVKAGQELHLNAGVNKQGIILRTDAGAIAGVEVLAYG